MYIELDTEYFLHRKVRISEMQRTD